MGKNSRHNEVKNLIQNEKLNVFVVVETHVKEGKVKDVCSNIFGNWLWATNSKWSPSGCRIMVGWDQRSMQVMVLHNSSQAMLCFIKDVNSKIRCYCTFIYAKNDGKERRALWKDLEVYK